MTPPRPNATLLRRRLLAAAARRARAMRQSAARSTSALGWLASWDSLTYFVLPVVAGGLLAPLAVWYLPRHVGLPLALAFTLWPLLALTIGSVAAVLGARRERAWRAALPFSLHGHRAALAGSVGAQMITFTFAALAPPYAELRRRLDDSGLSQHEVLLVGNKAHLELRVDSPSSHDQRAYHVLAHRIIDRVACPLHRQHAITHVSVA